VPVVSHGNTLRALVKHLPFLPAEQIAGLTVPTGIPLAFELADEMHPAVASGGGRYLGPEAA
jgi:2,3-bisphosphoglycerate-dependent phosphoglycerate mutase